MDADMRFGVEVEMEGLIFTLSKMPPAGVRAFWPVLPGQDVEQSMIGKRPILIPLSNTFPGAGPINWRGNWGFVVSGDSLDDSEGHGQCHFELGSSANYVSDHRHWTLFRAAAKAFRDSIAELRGAGAGAPDFTTPERSWYNITRLVQIYNNKITGFAATPIAQGIDLDLWRLRLSGDMLGLQAPGGAAGGGWQGYLCVIHDSIVCDAQVNYEIDLASLITDQGSSAWYPLWNHLHVAKISNVLPTSLNQPPGYDPPSGYQKNLNGVPDYLVYRNVMQLGLWKAAVEQAEAFVKSHPEPFAAGANSEAIDRFRKQVTALLAVMFACEAIIPTTGRGETKNTYSQLPKTSPSNAALQIYHASGIADAQERLRRYTASKIAADALAVVMKLRSLDGLKKYLPHAHPINWTFSNDEMPPYDQRTDDVELFESTKPAVTRFSGNFKDGFTLMWNSTFAIQENNATLTGAPYGYSSGDPWHVRWALANTSLPAVRWGQSQQSVKLVFESRLGLNRFNLGFNPDAHDEYFVLAYKNLLKLRGSNQGDEARITYITTSGQGGTAASVAQLQRDLDAAQNADEVTPNPLKKAISTVGWYH